MIKSQVGRRVGSTSVGLLCLRQTCLSFNQSFNQSTNKPIKCKFIKSIFKYFGSWMMASEILISIHFVCSCQFITLSGDLVLSPTKRLSCWSDAKVWILQVGGGQLGNPDTWGCHCLRAKCFLMVSVKADRAMSNQPLCTISL